MENKLENEINDFLSGELPVQGELPLETTSEPAPSSDKVQHAESSGEDPPSSSSETPAPIPVAETQSSIEQVQLQPTAQPQVSTSEPASDPRDSQITQMQETIAALQRTINDVAQSRTVAQPSIEEPEAQTIKFLATEDDVDNALKTANGMNTMLSGVVAKAQEMILPLAQQLAVQIAHSVYNQRRAADDFYTANQDLVANKAYVGMVADELARTNPEWNMLQVMEKLGDEVRNRLRLSGGQVAAPQQTQQHPAAPAPTPAPAFATGGGARPTGGAPVQNTLASEIADLLDGI